MTAYSQGCKPPTTKHRFTVVLTVVRIYPACTQSALQLKITTRSCIFGIVFTGC